MPVIKQTTTTVKKPLKQKLALTNIFDDAIPVEEMGETGHRFLIFGVSNTGKTTLASSFPKPLLMVRPEEVEDGSKSIRRVPGVFVTPPIIKADQLTDVCTRQKETNKYKTIVIDGIGKFQDLVVKTHMGLADAPIQATWGMASEADWNRIGITLKGFMRELMRLTENGTHVVFVGGERELEGKNVTSLAPTITVGLIPTCAGWLHEVVDYGIHTFKRVKIIKEKVKAGKGVQVIETATNDVEYVCRIAENTIFNTKFRKPIGYKLPKLMVNPTFDKIDAIIKAAHASTETQPEEAE